MDCPSCKHCGPVVIGSSHHRECHVLDADQRTWFARAVISDLGPGFFAMLGVKINEHGFKKGWAYWPVNFDPVWIEDCEYFEK